MKAISYLLFGIGIVALTICGFAVADQIKPGSAESLSGFFLIAITFAALASIGLAPTIAAGVIAHRRGRSGLSYFFVGSLIMVALGILHPAVGFVAGILVAVFAAFQPPLVPAAPQQQRRRNRRAE